MRQAAQVTDAAAGAAIAAISRRRARSRCRRRMPCGDDPRRRPSRRASGRSSARPRASARSTRPGATGVYRKGEPVFLELSGCVSRYHAPLGRLIRIGDISDEDAAMAEMTARALRCRREGAQARRQSARCLCRLAGRRRRGRPFPLPPPSLRLSGRHRPAAVMDRRQFGDRACGTIPISKSRPA